MNIEILALVISLVALTLTIITTYKTFWEHPTPVFSIMTHIAGYTRLESGSDVPYLFLEGILLNKSRRPLIPKSINLQVIHNHEWISLTHIYISNSGTYTIGDQTYRIKADAENYDLKKVNTIITNDKPQYFYSQFNIPKEIIDRLINMERVNFQFVIEDGFGKEYHYMLSLKRDGIDLSIPPRIYD